MDFFLENDVLFLFRQEKYEEKPPIDALRVALPRAKDALLRISRRALGEIVQDTTRQGENRNIFAFGFNARC